MAGAVRVDYGENGNAELTPKKWTQSVSREMGFASWEAEFGTRMMKQDRETGRCAALEGEAGKCVSCKVYEKRPKVCREFEPGSPLCIKARVGWALKYGKASVG